VIIGNETIDHIEIYDETGRFVCCISDDEIIEITNYKVRLCETEKMFTEDK